MKPSKFDIHCKTCKRPICELEGTKEGNIVVYCKACGEAEVLGK